MDRAQTLELSKELLDLMAFLFVTPDILKDRFEEWVTTKNPLMRKHGTELLKWVIMAPWKKPGSNIMQEYKETLEDIHAKSAIAFVVAWIMVYFFISSMLVSKFGGFEIFDYTSWQSILLLVIGILIFILFGVLVSFLMTRISAHVMGYILRKGVSRIFLALGLFAFLAARLLGVASALLRPT